jgi:hypothetical protein
LAIALLWLSIDGNLYWHDIRFSYAASHFSMSEILSGIFNPHQIGGDIDETSASGFYLSKVLHVWLIQQLYKWRMPSEGGFFLSTWLSVIYLGLSLFFSYWLYKRLFQNERRAWFAIYCFMLIPVTGYLAGKILAEALAHLMIIISISSFVAAIDARREKVFWLISGSGIFLTLAALSRLDVLFCLLGFITAYIFCAETKKKRKKIVQFGIILLAFFAIAYMGTIYYIGGEINDLIQYFKKFIGIGIKSNMMSVIGILTFGGAIYFFSLSAILSPHKKKALFFAIWFFVSSGLVVLITHKYMVEPRYLFVGILPLCGLGALGVEVLWKKLTRKPYKFAIIGSLVTLILALNTVTMRIMPYELNSSSMINAIDNIIKLSGKPAILIPWFYTDFHFIRMMKPNLKIYNVNSPRRDGILFTLDKRWQERLNYWHKDAYIDSVSELNKILTSRPVFYLGWEKYPPVENTVKMLKLLRLYRLSSLIDQIPLTNHLAESWIWDSKAYQFELAGKCSQYKYYKISLNP